MTFLSISTVIILFDGVLYKEAALGMGHDGKPSGSILIFWSSRRREASVLDMVDIVWSSDCVRGRAKIR